jgi:hypothetical protein
MTIRPPRRPDRYPDRDLDCQEAIESPFQEMMENILAAGWGPEEVAEAIEHLAMADRMARDEKGRIDATLEIQRVIATRSA